MKIGIVNIYSFPFGLAPTNRILAYSKGLVENGADCEIISLKPQVRKYKEINRNGIINGAEYFHFLQIPSIKNRILKSITFRIGNIICFWKALWHIYKSNTRKHYDAIILSFDQPVLLLPIILILRILKISIYTIADEYPTPIRKKLKSTIPLYKKLCYRFISGFLKGRILMTNKLAHFYNEIHPLPYLLLSTITDTTRFEGCTNNITKLDQPYLCYMGNMELSKDNVDNIIKAFSMIHSQYPSLKFYLFGNPSKNDKETINSLISKLNLNASIKNMGLAQYEEVPSILHNAKILVTSQPNTKRAEGGFPTKMGEYMMSGKPSVLTDVGEIHDYVKDKENVYMVSPDNPKEYAETLIYILQHYDEAIKVADTARKYIIDNFSTLSSGRQILSFIMRT